MSTLIYLRARFWDARAKRARRAYKAYRKRAQSLFERIGL